MVFSIYSRLENTANGISLKSIWMKLAGKRGMGEGEQYAVFAAAGMEMGLGGTVPVLDPTCEGVGVILPPRYSTLQGSIF